MVQGSCGVQSGAFNTCKPINPPGSYAEAGALSLRSACQQPCCPPRRLGVRHVRTLKMADDVLCARITPDGRLLALALLDSTIQVRTFARLAIYPGKGSPQKSYRLLLCASPRLVQPATWRICMPMLC